MAVDGTYTIQFRTPGGTQTGKLTLQTTGASLGGTYVTGQTTYPLSDGTVTGDDIAFAYVQSTPVGKMKLLFKGKVVGDEISGQVKLGGPFGSSAFTGKRV